MGTQKGQPLKINTKKLAKAAKLECMNELQTFFTCMTVRDLLKLACHLMIKRQQIQCV